MKKVNYRDNLHKPGTRLCSPSILMNLPASMVVQPYSQLDSMSTKIFVTNLVSVPEKFPSVRTFIIRYNWLTVLLKQARRNQ